VPVSYQPLNSEQKRAVETSSGPVLILAGAGAGKTRTIVERIGHLIKNGVAPSSILAITFTNKAAREMRERVQNALANDPGLNLPISMSERPFVSTFHALGVHILREQGYLVGLKKNFAIFDREDSKKAIKEALEILGLDPKTHEPGKFLGIISAEKGRGQTFADYQNSERSGYIAEVLTQLWPEYERILKRDNCLDFDDLLLKTNQILREIREIREYYRKVWSHVHIDEYQDTNRVQYEISKMLVGPEQNICVVGDIDQNIYSWRGAELRNILAFEKDYPEAVVVTLEENYRSSGNILEAANAVIEKNKIRVPKKLFTKSSKGEEISVKAALDGESEALFIAATAEKLIREGVSPDEIAVLYRANFQSRAMEEAFLSRNVPYQLLGTKFFERKEVKDVLAYLKAALNSDSLTDIKRIINVPARGIGKASIAKIFAGQGDNLPVGMKVKYAKFQNLLLEIAEMARIKRPSETIAFIIKESGLEEEFKSGGEDGAARLENVYELVNFAGRYSDYETFLTDVALQSDQDELDENRPAVRLMTVHAAKGLEFEVVFIAGLEEGLFPHSKIYEGNLTPEEAEEERRLFYVALTRAKKKVYLSYAQTRNIFGRQQVNMPSEFIFDIPEHLLEYES